MPYDIKRFIFSVSLCAMLAVNPVLATAPTNDEDLDTTHEVYTELSESANGIAGVSYVNRMVNAAGNAAELAEGHAAAAGAHALSAAQSADEAHKVLADKVSIDQGEDNKNKVMVTNASGYVAPGYIQTNMIADGGSFSPEHTNYSGMALWSDHSGIISWRPVDGSFVPLQALTPQHMKSNSSYEVLMSNGYSAEWGKVVPANTKGVVGAIPIGSADATTYGQFWIE